MERPSETRLGFKTSQGPEGSSVIVFGGDKVSGLTTTGTKILGGKKKFWAKACGDPMWRKIQKDYVIAAQVTLAFPPSLPLVTPGSTSCSISLEDCLKVMPSILNYSGKVPRCYQVEAFQRGLLNNTIIVIATGCGKTLIASMIMARMVDLNPARVALMVVDRIPLGEPRHLHTSSSVSVAMKCNLLCLLTPCPTFIMFGCLSPGLLFFVFQSCNERFCGGFILEWTLFDVAQQKRAIENDTGLLGATLCGADATALYRSNLLNGNAQFIVATAGALQELLRNYGVTLERFSVIVFDECHHATKNHPYSQILTQVKNCRDEFRPRLIGRDYNQKYIIRC